VKQVKCREHYVAVETQLAWTCFKHDGFLKIYCTVVWPTTSCYADWSKRDHMTLVIIGRCTLERVTVQHVHVAPCNMFR